MPSESKESATVITPGDRTHAKDLKNLVQVYPPSGNCLFVFLRVETPKDRIPLNPLEELLLNICHGTVIEGIKRDG